MRPLQVGPLLLGKESPHAGLEPIREGTHGNNPAKTRGGRRPEIFGTRNILFVPSDSCPRNGVF